MKDIGTINSRIVATNGKFRTEKGDRDATVRMQDLPTGIRLNFSAGYNGKAMQDIVEAERERRATSNEALN